ncbi:Transcription factor [Quillaja saponaria]|uniref:Transcription factor n=1 Tax=Quillaja saponaria TaxID=32244 RepID=A0AAD7M4Q2_QUISA|nr:Transcription factor [Quillaja saponaria]
MASYPYNSTSSSGFDISSLSDPFLHNPDDFNGVLCGGSASLQSPVLNSEKGELVKAPGRLGKKGALEAKALAALKKHSEAERRRRERINGHLATLRGFVSCTEKMDKATVLAEVIRQVKELKKKAVEASKGFLFPMDSDEVKVEPFDDEGGDGTQSYKASVCCDYRPELLSELRQALDALQLDMVKAEISTLGCRVESTFVFCKGGSFINIENCQLLACTVKQALSNVLDKTSTSLEYSPRTSPPSKRPRICFSSTSTSSSCNDETMHPVFVDPAKVDMS